MSTEQERTFVEAAARVAYVMAWTEREGNPPDGLRIIEWHDRTGGGDDFTKGTARGTWGAYQPQGHRSFTPWPAGDTIYLFDDEVDSDEPAPARSFTGPGAEPSSAAYA